MDIVEYLHYKKLGTKNTLIEVGVNGINMRKLGLKRLNPWDQWTCYGFVSYRDPLAKYLVNIFSEISPTKLNKQLGKNLIEKEPNLSGNNNSAYYMLNYDNDDVRRILYKLKGIN